MIGRLRLVAFGVCVAACAGELNVVYDWGKNIDLSPGRRGHDGRNATAAAEDYVPGNNLVYRMRIWDGAMYVAVPRFKRGVPATLCKSYREPGGGGGGTALKPFPTAGMQNVGNCFGVQNVKDIEIDHLGQLWTLDSGEVHDLQRTAATPDYTCDPKLLVLNTSSGALLRSAVVPGSMYTAGRSVLSGLSVDLKTLTAVVADVGAADPGFLVYGLQTGVYRKFRCKRLRSAAAPAENYNEALLAISPIDSMLYFTTVELDNMFAIPLSVFDVPASRLRADDYDVSHYANDLGPKADTATAITVDSAGRLYMGMPRMVTAWDTMRGGFEVNEPYVQDVRLEWISSFAFDPDGYLWIVSSAFRDFVDAGSDGARPANVKIFKIHCGATAFALLAAAGTAANDTAGRSSVRTKTVTAAAPLAHYVFTVLALQMAFARRTAAND